jgi:hypothetical protein
MWWLTQKLAITAGGCGRFDKRQPPAVQHGRRVPDHAREASLDNTRVRLH